MAQEVIPISKEAIKAYELVNGLNDLAMPQLKNYQELKNELKKQSKRDESLSI